MRISLFSAALLMVFAACVNQSKPPVVAEARAVPVRLQTHAEAADTLLADSTRPRKPLKFRQLQWQELSKFMASQDLSSLLKNSWPDNGFYGDNRYRIEFVFTKVVKSTTDPALYFVEGKNRHKKTVTPFHGTMRIGQVRAFSDPNMDEDETDAIGFGDKYAVAGTFEFPEDSAQLATSGLFKGNFKLDFVEIKNAEANTATKDLWFFSDDAPASGSGYRFDGTWASYVKKDMVKPVIWSRDLFRFANGVLKDFSYGERDIEINPAYRALGWDNYWDAEEWWTDNYVKPAYTEPAVN